MRKLRDVWYGLREGSNRSIDLRVNILYLLFIARNQLESESVTNQMRMTGDLD